MAEEREKIGSEQPAEFMEESAATELAGEKSEEVTELELLQSKMVEAQKAAEVLKDQLLRKAAELENYKRRTEAEAFNLYKNANERLILALIPIVNDFVRSLKSGGEAKDYDAFYKGVELIYSNFRKVLEKEGLTAFESLGKPFDVQFHDALLQMPKEGIEPNTVIEEIEPGYKLNDRILRHAKVIVSTAPQNPEAPSPTNQEEAKA